MFALFSTEIKSPSYKENYTTCVLTGEMRRGRSVFTLFSTEIKSPSYKENDSGELAEGRALVITLGSCSY